MEKRLEQLFYVALGSAMAVKDKVEKNREEFRQAADKAEETARDFFTEMAERGEQEKEGLRTMLRDLLKEVVSELNLATKDDFEQLRKDLEKS
jgi:polyhydroxyalkanoate synthesis regulator phasin